MQGPSREAAASARERLDALVRERAPLERLGDDMFGLVDLLDREATLRQTLADPVLPAQAKERLVDELLGRQLGGEALDLLRGMVAPRWSRPRDLVDTAETIAVSASLAAAEQEGTLDEVEDELFRFSRIVEREPGLRRALADDAVPAEQRNQLLRGLLADRVQPTTLRLLDRAVTAPRGRTLDQVLGDYAVLAAERRARLLAEVRVARPLNRTQTRRLRAGLARLYGRDVQLQVEVDPRVVGGVHVRVGDEIVDGTVAGQLDAARRRLTG